MHDNLKLSDSLPELKYLWEDPTQSGEDLKKIESNVSSGLRSSETSLDVVLFMSDLVTTLLRRVTHYCVVYT